MTTKICEVIISTLRTWWSHRPQPRVQHVPAMECQPYMQMSPPRRHRSTSARRVLPAHGSGPQPAASQCHLGENDPTDRNKKQDAASVCDFPTAAHAAAHFRPCDPNRPSACEQTHGRDPAFAALTTSQRKPSWFRGTLLSHGTRKLPHWTSSSRTKPLRSRGWA